MAAMLQISGIEECQGKGTSVAGAKVTTISSASTKTGRLPSATEVFHLRSECANLSEKIYKAKEADLEPWLNTSNYGWWHQVTEDSHYDPVSNRCYSKLTIRTTDRANSGYEEWDQELYDGQTKEMLALTRNQVAPGKYPVEAKVGEVFVLAPPQYDDNYKGASDYIDQLMKDDRAVP